MAFLGGATAVLQSTRHCTKTASRKAWLAAAQGPDRAGRLFQILFHSHPIGNMHKTIDFIGDIELHGSKKRLIPSHGTKKRQKRPIFEVFVEFLGDDCDPFSCLGATGFQWERVFQYSAHPSRAVWVPRAKRSNAVSTGTAFVRSVLTPFHSPSRPMGCRIWRAFGKRSQLARARAEASRQRWNRSASAEKSATRIFGFYQGLPLFSASARLRSWNWSRSDSFSFWFSAARRQTVMASEILFWSS